MATIHRLTALALGTASAVLTTIVLAKEHAAAATPPVWTLHARVIATGLLGAQGVRQVGRFLWLSRAQRSFATAGPVSPNRTSAEPGWQSIDGAMFKARLAQEAVGASPTDREKKGKQAPSAGGRTWRPVVAHRDRSKRE